MKARERLRQYIAWERARSRRGTVATWIRFARIFGMRSWLDLMELLNPTKKAAPSRDVKLAIYKRTLKRWPEGAITLAEWGRR